MPLQDWTVYAFETTTGRIAAEIPFINVSQFEYGLNNLGSGTVTVPLGGNGMSTADIDELTQPWRWSWAVCYRQFICQAGPVISEQMTDTQPYTQVTFAGIWKLFSKRILFPSTFTSGTNPAVTAADTQYTGLTYLQMASNIVGTSMARGALPIILPPTDPPGTSTIQYYGYEMDLVADMLSNLTGLVGGPEIEFRPQFNPSQPNYIQWVMRVGSPRLGQIGSSWAFDYGPRGSIQQMDFTRDGSQMTFSDYLRGSGSEYDLVVGNGQDLGLVAAGYPLLEDVNGDHTTVVDPDTANSYAQQWCDTYQYPVNTPGALVRVDALDLSGAVSGSPTLDQIAVGDTAAFTIQSHRRIPDGTYTYRIVQIDNGSSYDNVKLTLQPVTGMG
jgi:hypothetical protein